MGHERDHVPIDIRKDSGREQQVDRAVLARGHVCDRLRHHGRIVGACNHQIERVADAGLAVTSGDAQAQNAIEVCRRLS